MSSTLQNSQKAQRRNLQRFYSFYLSAAMLVCGILLLTLITSLFSVIRIGTEVALLITLAILVLFAPFSFYLKSKNKNHSLKIPPHVPEKVLKFIRNTAVVFFILIFAFDTLIYPYAPIKPDGNTFTDKIGKVYSYSEFLFFKKWEFTFVILWSIAALQTFVFLPFFDGQIKKWWKL
jgi:hypothetical protein